MKFYKRRIEDIKVKRERAISGQINGIPTPFPHFRQEFPCIQKAKYYLLSANQKVGKTQITDYLFLITPLLYAYNNPDKAKVKILYFSLEMSINEKYDQLTCWWLYMHSKGKMRLSIKDLNSLNEENPLSEDVLAILESQEYQKFFDFVDDNVIFSETDRHPYGIYKACVDYATNHGKLYYKTKTFTDNKTKQTYTNQVIDRFEPDDPNEYWIVIGDHLGLLDSEKGGDLRASIGKLSATYNTILRNTYGFTLAMVQQQAADKEGNDSFKLGRLTPSPDGLADNKTTSRDCNVMLGLFSPWRFHKGTWEGYDITVFKDNIRFLEVCIDRNGSAGAVCPLYFDGAVNFFCELPAPSNKEALVYFEQMAINAQNN